MAIRHPSLWIFLRKLKDLQRQTEMSMIAGERGDAPPPRRRKWRHLERRIQRLKRQYNNGQRTLAEYWQAITYAMKQFV